MAADRVADAEPRRDRRRRGALWPTLLQLLAALSALATIWAFLGSRFQSREPEPERKPRSSPSVVETVRVAPDEPASTIVVCEVIVKGPGVDPAGERITLCNGAAAPVDLGGWHLTDGEGVYPIPAVVLGSGDRWTVTGAELNPRRSTHRIWLNDGGDEVRLLDRSGRLVDSCGWPPKESSVTCRKLWR